MAATDLALRPGEASPTTLRLRPTWIAGGGGPVVLAGTDGASSGQSGAMTLVLAIAAVNAAASGQAGAMYLLEALAAVSAGITSQSGAMLGPIAFGGTNPAQGGQSGSMVLGTALGATNAAQSAQSGAMTGPVPLAGSAAALSSQLGAMIVTPVPPLIVANIGVTTRRSASGRTPVTAHATAISAHAVAGHRISITVDAANRLASAVTARPIVTAIIPEITMPTIGTRVRISVSWLDNGALFDPAVVRLRVLAPRTLPAEHVYGIGSAIVRTGAGLYHHDWLPTSPGTYRYSWVSAALNEEVVQEGFFEVVAPRV